MQYPPIKTIEAVKARRSDHRIRRSALHFRRFFRFLDAHGVETDNDDKIVNIELSQRGNEYYSTFLRQRLASVAPRSMAA